MFVYIHSEKSQQEQLELPQTRLSRSLEGSRTTAIPIVSGSFGEKHISAECLV